MDDNNFSRTTDLMTIILPVVVMIRMFDSNDPVMQTNASLQNAVHVMPSYKWWELAKAMAPRADDGNGGSMDQLADFAIAVLSKPVSVGFVERCHKVWKRCVAPVDKKSKHWPTVNMQLKIAVNSRVMDKIRDPSYLETFPETNVRSAEALAEESSEGEGCSSDSDCDESSAALG